MRRQRARARLVAVVAALCAALGATGCDDPPPLGPVDPPPVDSVPSPDQEGRALWVTRWDWYDRPELEALIDDAARSNFNILYVQVRGRSDAYYEPGLEPWAQRPPVFTLGQDPGWDPLAVAVERGHARGLEVHAWLNTLIGWCTSQPIPETEPRHILLEHPDWAMLGETGATTAENCVFLNPAVPGVRARAAGVAADLARRYPVDGLHLDYIRYPSPDFSYDSVTLAALEAARADEPALSFDDFRRRMIDATVREVRDSLHAVGPALPLSAAVVGIYRNVRGWAGVTAGYDTRFQDSRGWAEDGIIDVVAPMIYWDIEPVYGDRLDFAALADEFASTIDTRHVYIGMGVEASAEGFCRGCDVVRQIYRSREAGADGVAVFNARLLREQRLWDALESGPFRRRVPVPAMPWLLGADAMLAERAAPVPQPRAAAGRRPSRPPDRSSGR